MKPRTTVLFDVMDTLVHDPFRDVMPRFFGMTLAELIAAKHPTAFVEFELDRRTEAEFLEDFFADGRAYDHAGFVAAVTGAYRLLPGIEELLVHLSSSGFELHTASNYPRWYERVEARTGLSRYVRWSGVSCELGVRKPDARFFECLLGRIGRTPDECVFVDDQPRNCDAAAALGIHAIRFVDADSLGRALDAALGPPSTRPIVGR